MLHEMGCFERGHNMAYYMIPMDDFNHKSKTSTSEFCYKIAIFFSKLLKTIIPQLVHEDEIWGAFHEILVW